MSYEVISPQRNNRSIYVIMAYSLKFQLEASQYNLPLSLVLRLTDKKPNGVLIYLDL